MPKQQPSGAQLARDKITEQTAMKYAELETENQHLRALVAQFQAGASGSGSSSSSASIAPPNDSGNNDDDEPNERLSGDSGAPPSGDATKSSTSTSGDEVTARATVVAAANVKSSTVTAVAVAAVPAAAPAPAVRDPPGMVAALAVAAVPAAVPAAVLAVPSAAAAALAPEAAPYAEDSAGEEAKLALKSMIAGLTSSTTVLGGIPVNQRTSAAAFAARAQLERAVINARRVGMTWNSVHIHIMSVAPSKLPALPAATHSPSAYIKWLLGKLNWSSLSEVQWAALPFDVNAVDIKENVDTLITAALGIDSVMQYTPAGAVVLTLKRVVKALNEAKHSFYAQAAVMYHALASSVTIPTEQAARDVLDGRYQQPRAHYASERRVGHFTTGGGGAFVDATVRRRRQWPPARRQWSRTWRWWRRQRTHRHRRQLLSLQRDGPYCEVLRRHALRNVRWLPLEAAVRGKAD